MQADSTCALLKCHFCTVKDRKFYGKTAAVWHKLLGSSDVWTWFYGPWLETWIAKLTKSQAEKHEKAGTLFEVRMSFQCSVDSRICKEMRKASRKFSFRKLVLRHWRSFQGWLFAHQFCWYLREHPRMFSLINATFFKLKIGSVASWLLHDAILKLCASILNFRKVSPSREKAQNQIEYI